MFRTVVDTPMVAARQRGRRSVDRQERQVWSDEHGRKLQVVVLERLRDGVRVVGIGEQEPCARRDVRHRHGGGAAVHVVWPQRRDGTGLRNPCVRAIERQIRGEIERRHGCAGRRGPAVADRVGDRQRAPCRSSQRRRERGDREVRTHPDDCRPRVVDLVQLPDGAVAVSLREEVVGARPGSPLARSALPCPWRLPPLPAAPTALPWSGVSPVSSVAFVERK